ncbi:SURF1 family protein [Brevundimonas kwangchunensis]|uniref:SURF1-like protein n=1 Tax=Brevundimonas kwangchunensis TaxID=322163 RepID=A0ABN1GRC9_9CAUL
MRRFPWILTLVCALALALLLSLGVWQVQRLQWKSGLIAAAEAAAAMPPVPVMQAYRPTDEFRSVIIDCPGLATAPFVELQTIEDGQAGVRLISVCPLPSEPMVTLVDRGFVPDTVSARPPVQPSTTPVRIVGQVRMPPEPSQFAPPPEGNHFYARDHQAMGRALGADKWLASPMIFATTSSNPDWQALRPHAPPAAFSNNHLGYAMTWFGLAIALVGFYIALLRRKLSAPTPSGETEKSST